MAARDPKNARVEVPLSAAKLFDSNAGISLDQCAKALGFAGPTELEKFAGAQLKKFNDSERLSPVIGAKLFNRLVVLCASKTADAKLLLEELSSCWTSTEGGSKTVSFPSHPKPPSGPLLPWPVCSPEAVGMDKAPFDRVHQYLQWRTKMKHFAGVTCGVVRRGQVAFYHESGYADAESKVKMSGDTIIRLFSMTKCLVAAAFMTFWEDPSSDIDLDDPVSKYIPAFAVGNLKVLPNEKKGQSENQPCEKPVTLRQLLTHTSGLGYGATLGDPWPPEEDSYYKIYQDLCERSINGSIKNLEEWCQALAQVPLKGQPGQYWDYGFGLDVLGRVLEIIAKKPLDVIMEERICAPLGMRDTGFSVPEEKLDRLGPWYQSHGVEGKPNAAHTLEIVDKAGASSGWAATNVSKILSGGGTVEVPLAMKGGMVGTFNDYLRFLLMLRNCGELDGVRVLQKSTVQHMICNHIPASCYGKKNINVFDKPGFGYGLLGAIQAQHAKQEKGTVSGEYGWGGLAGPAWTLDPRADLIVLSMTQTAFVLDHEEYVRYAARRAIHQHAFGVVAAPTKATSYPPETADAIHVKPKQPVIDAAPSEVASVDEIDLQEEHTRQGLDRLQCVAEAVFRPGRGLDRPSGDGPPDADSDEAPTPVAKRARLAATRPNQGLLFSRVKVHQIPGEQGLKARVTAIEGDRLEVITEGNWKEMNVSVGSVVQIEETNIGQATKVEPSQPTDFSFLMPKGGVV